jgi:hypothetical protein
MMVSDTPQLMAAQGQTEPLGKLAKWFATLDGLCREC